MQQDGITAAQIKLFLSAFATHAALETMGLASPKQKDAAAPVAAPVGVISPPRNRLNRACSRSDPPRAASLHALTPTPRFTQSPAVPTTKVHWDALKLDDAALKKSLWGRIGSDAADELESEDAELLTNMFAAAKVAAPAAGPETAAGGAAAPEKLHTLCVRGGGLATTRTRASFPDLPHTSPAGSTSSAPTT